MFCTDGLEVNCSVTGAIGSACRQTGWTGVGWAGQGERLSWGWSPAREGSWQPTKSPQREAGRNGRCLSYAGAAPSVGILPGVQELGKTEIQVRAEGGGKRAVTCFWAPPTAGNCLSLRSCCLGLESYPSGLHLVHLSCLS